MKLIYIGEDFYWKSGTMMSSIYEKDTWERSDWGKVAIALGNGEEIYISPATEKELEIANKILNKSD